MSAILGWMALFHCKQWSAQSSLLLSKDDEDANSSTKEVTLEDMYSAAKEVDGTGTVDTTSNAAERLKLNQATSTTASENSNQQVTVQKKSPARLPLATFFSPLCIHWWMTSFYFCCYIVIMYPCLPLFFHVSYCSLKVSLRTIQSHGTE